MVLKLPGWITGLTEDGSPWEPSGNWGIYASHIGDYMRRGIIKTPWRTFRVHRILREDRDPTHHDHPMDFVSFIWKGGYVEERWVGGRLCVYPRTTHSLVRFKAEDAHRITFVLPGTVTLVLAKPKHKEWGFITPEGWIHHRDYDSPGR